MCVGVCNKKLRRYEDALEVFNKLHNILRNSAQVMFQLADLYPLLSQTERERERERDTHTDRWTRLQCWWCSDVVIFVSK